MAQDEGREGRVLKLRWFTFVIIDAIAASPTGLVVASL